MSHFDFIINPTTGKKVRLSSSIGKLILKSYSQFAGGDSFEEVTNYDKRLQIHELLTTDYKDYYDEIVPQYNYTVFFEDDKVRVFPTIAYYAEGTPDRLKLNNAVGTIVDPRKLGINLTDNQNIAFRYYHPEDLINHSEFPPRDFLYTSQSGLEILEFNRRIYFSDNVQAALGDEPSDEMINYAQEYGDIDIEFNKTTSHPDDVSFYSKFSGLDGNKNEKLYMVNWEKEGEQFLSVMPVSHLLVAKIIDLDSDSESEAESEAESDSESDSEAESELDSEVDSESDRSSVVSDDFSRAIGDIMPDDESFHGSETHSLAGDISLDTSIEEESMVINQTGGVFVRLSNLQLRRLYEVRKEYTNDACGANAFNILGIDSDIVETMRLGFRDTGVGHEQARQQLQRFVKKIRRREADDHIEREIDWDEEAGVEWIISSEYPTPISSRGRDEYPSQRDRNNWIGWNQKTKNGIKRWLKQHIPEGYITMIGIPGHWVILGRTRNRGDLIIIESQQGGDGGRERRPGATYSCGNAGIYLGDREVIQYLEDIFRNSGDIFDNADIYVPNQSIGISAVEPKYQKERYVDPLSRLARQPSTYSDDGSGSSGRQYASQKKQKKPFGNGLGPFGKSQRLSRDSSGSIGHGVSPFDQGSSPIAQGSSPIAQGSSPFAQGVSPFTTGSGSIAQGVSPFAQGSSPIAQGVSPFAQGSGSIAQGVSPFTHGSGSISHGLSPFTTGSGSIGHGLSPFTTGSGSFPTQDTSQKSSPWFR
jgi:hypothetical protein